MHTHAATFVSFRVLAYTLHACMDDLPIRESSVRVAFAARWDAVQPRAARRTLKCVYMAYHIYIRDGLCFRRINCATCMNNI